MQSEYLKNIQRENFEEAYRLHLECQRTNKNMKLKILKLTFPKNFYYDHRQLIEDWIDNCNRNLKPREYGINYLQPTIYKPNVLEGLAILPNKPKQNHLLLSNDSEIIGEDKIVTALYNESATLEIEITETNASTITDYYANPELSKTIAKTLKIKHQSPKYYTEEIL